MIKSTRIIAAAATTLVALAATAQVHREITLSEGWQFSRDNASWQQVTVPHDWAIAGPFDKKWDLQMVAIKENGEDVATEHSGRSGGLPWIGRGTYRTTVTIPSGYKRALLVFDGAMASPHVTLNGQLAGSWEYGYNSFIVDITPYMHVGDNALQVDLENLPESNRWYPGGGIYRPVTLLLTETADALDTWGLAFTTTALSDDHSTATVELRHRLCEGADLTGDYTLEATLSDDQGVAVAKSTSHADGMGKFAMTMTVRAPRLWSPEHPNRYTLAMTLKRDGRVVDQQTTKTGVRTIAVDRTHGFTLNGQPRKFKGVCLHHDLGPLGAAVNRTAIVRQIKMMKAMGADAIRTSHNMPSTMQMEICDSMGMMVMAESFDGWSEAKVANGYNRLWNDWWQRDITNLVEHHRNHPSIVMWSVGNEIPEQWKPEGAQRYKDLTALCHTLDPSRPVTCGMDNVDGVLSSGFAQVADVPGFNYRVHRYDGAIGKLPQGFLLGSETASTVSSRGVYKFPDTCITNKAWPDGQCSSYDVEYCWWSNLPDDDWRMQDDRSWTIGEFVWTGYDYLGEPTPYDSYWPSRSSYFGICDLAGLPKDRYYLYRSHWNTGEPTLHVLPHWTWPGREGKVTPVYCYTSYPEAELFVNGRSMGRVAKDTTTRLDRYRLRWRDVKYEPGEITVVAYDAAGRRAASQTVRTAGTPARILLEPECETLTAGSDELAYVTVSLVDKKGTLCPDADNQLKFDVTGAGTFVAACNGDATSVEPFTEPTMRLFHGQLVVICRPAANAGTLTLTVTDVTTGLHHTLTLPVKK